MKIEYNKKFLIIKYWVELTKLLKICLHIKMDFDFKYLLVILK